MIAVFDCGNSGIKTGIYEGRTAAALFRLEEGPQADPAGQFFAELEKAGISADNISQTVICAVTDSGNTAAGQITEKLTVGRFDINPARFNGLRHRYRTPEKLGADRICAAAAAVRLHPDTDIIIADLGSAITVDAVDSEGTFLGGTITMGYSALAEAMNRKFARLDVPGPVIPDLACGGTTRESLAAGMYYTVYGALEKIISSLEKECFSGRKALRLACGGDTRFFRESGIFDKIYNNLVLDGALELFYEYGGNK